MDLIFELITELILEGSMEISQNKKISKWIRYPLIFLIGLLFLGVILLIFFVGMISLKENIYLGLFFFLVGLLLLVTSILKFRKIYLDKK